MLEQVSPTPVKKIQIHHGFSRYRSRIILFSVTGLFVVATALAVWFGFDLHSTQQKLAVAQHNVATLRAPSKRGSTHSKHSRSHTNSQPITKPITQ